MKDRIFVDTNIWVYLFANEDNRKCKMAEKFIAESGPQNILIISYQVINELSNVLVRKNFAESTVRSIIEQLTRICVVQDYSRDIALLASTIRENHSFSFWDSHIIASAITAQCAILASEDMQAGQIISGICIRNIFTG